MVNVKMLSHKSKFKVSDKPMAECVFPEKARSKIAQNNIVQVEVLNIMVVKLSFMECATIAFQSALLSFLASAVTFSELTLFYSLTFSVSAIIGPN